MSVGVIYILTNPSFPDYVKIGYADNLENRLNELNRSECIPFAFRAYAIYEVNSRLTDIVLHNLIDTLNPTLRSIDDFDGKKRKKEFYAMSAEDAYSLLESIAKISGTEDKLKKVKPEGHELQDEEIAEEVEQESKRREKFTFSEANIEIGEIINYKNDKTITAQVVDDRTVLYEGEKFSLTALAKKLSGKQTQIQGPIYFEYEGETLDNRRKRIEQENNEK